MRILDLFCGAGGAGMGYHKAGFEVVGVDINPQPNYPFEFHQADAITFPSDGFDAIHASPPCQVHSVISHLAKSCHVDLIPQTREKLVSSKLPYAIENVPGSPLLDPIMLCGSMFGLKTECGTQLRRHRLFEISGFKIKNIPKCNHALRTIGIFGDKARDTAAEKRHYSKPKSTRGKPVGIKFSLDDARTAMGIDWMSFKEISQAIPPAYTEFIGLQALSAQSLIPGGK